MAGDRGAFGENAAWAAEAITQGAIRSDGEMDGSHHAWFEQRAKRCCPMLFVDDATGRMLSRFYQGETLVGGDGPVQAVVRLL